MEEIQNPKSKIQNYFLAFFVIILIFIPFSLLAIEKQLVTCKSGQTVECYVGGLFGGRMKPECVCCGDCTLNDALAFGLNIADLILKFLGVVALLLFIYGGIRWIFSGGNPESIRAGKAVVSGAVVGMVVILAAFLIVQTVLKTLAPGWELSEPKTESWPSCLVPPTNERPWCYGCTWVGGQGKGCQGNEVAGYQSVLNALGCDCGPVDGFFGSKTKECTKRFQQANDLNIDGMVGPATYAKYKSDNPLPNPCQ